MDRNDEEYSTVISQIIDFSYVLVVEVQDTLNECSK